MNRLLIAETSVYSAIVRFINEHKYSPSCKELCELTGFSSTATVYRAVQRLEEKGFIARTAKWGNRGITLTKAHPDCDVVEVRHGHWVKTQCSEKDGDANCSECGHFDWSDCNYCSSCGTKMDGKEAK